MSTGKTTDLYPLELAPLIKDKVWGGTRLRRWFPSEAPAQRLIGEVWTVWDELPVANGPWRGRPLAELVRSRPQQLLGSRWAGVRSPLFPLLVKWVDTSQRLSVQVHPGDEYALRREGAPFGKAELWYVIHAEPGAGVYHGVKQRLSRSEVEQAVASGTLQDVLQWVELAAGDVIMNRPGTIHALGPGLLLYELQESSDLTYRLYDWNRNLPGRPLHVEKALDVADLEPHPSHVAVPDEVREPGATRWPLCVSRWFALERLRVPSNTTERPGGRSFHLLTVLEGTGRLESASAVNGVPLCPGWSVLVPAAIEEYQVRADREPLVLLKGTVPDTWVDIVAAAAP
jgi:mannose-6-phosphate isomerase